MTSLGTMGIGLMRCRQAAATPSHSIELTFETLKADPNTASMFDYAIAHHNIIQKFGRFPHRNVILGCPSTPEELEFLTQPNSSF